MNRFVYSMNLALLPVLVLYQALVPESSCQTFRNSGSGDKLHHGGVGFLHCSELPPGRSKIMPNSSLSMLPKLWRLKSRSGILNFSDPRKIKEVLAGWAGEKRSIFEIDDFRL